MKSLSTVTPVMCAETAACVVTVKGEEEWLVEEILDARKIRRSLNYLVKWVGFDNPTWQPAADITHSPELLQEFYERFPTKPR